jgi:hypothetical protein
MSRDVDFIITNLPNLSKIIRPATFKAEIKK